MATSKPEDKYAFLFTGTTEKPYVIDINNVFGVLTDFYNYPASHITVMSPASADLNCPGARIHDLTTGLKPTLEEFASAASGPSNTALLYFTGGGDRPAGESQIIAGGDAFTVGDLASCLETLDCQLNVVMQQSYSGGFRAAFNQAKQWSFTYACDAASRTFSSESEGSFFTRWWVEGLKLESLPASAVGVHGGDSALALDDAARPELISLRAAAEFARLYEQFVMEITTAGYADDGFGPYYLGEPDLLISDGDPWFESPDIYLTHGEASAHDDLYIPDADDASAPFHNNINVKTTNVGTHPVARYSLRIQVVETGTGPDLMHATFENMVPHDGRLRPTKSDEVKWNVKFKIETTHACVRARAGLLPSQLDDVWDITRRDCEAQRNIDPMPVAANHVKEHEYAITNRFDTRRNFHVDIPEQALDTRHVELAWFEKAGDRLEPLVIIDEPRPHLLVPLDPGESRTLVVRVVMKEALPAGEELRLPFSIAVEDGDTVADIAGVTVAIREATATVEGKIIDENGKPVVHAPVRVETIDGRQATVVETDADGHYALENINPDVYRIVAQTKQGDAGQTFVLRDGERRRLSIDQRSGVRVKVVLDRIRVIDDHDRGRGKGEIVFNSVVVPDSNPLAKQTMRLPAKGAYHVSDRPGSNELSLGVTVFEGTVNNGALDLTIDGFERDPKYKREALQHYHRSISGDLEVARHDIVGDWALWYHIERVQP